MRGEAELRSLKDEAGDVLAGIKTWKYSGEESRAVLHQLGARLRKLQDRVTRLLTNTLFPSFTSADGMESADELQDRARRRRDLVVMTTKLAPSNMEILELLGKKDDKEAAYLYAYARGSVLGPAGGVRTQFYDMVEAMEDDDPVLAEAKDIAAIVASARDRYSIAQAEGYQNMT